MDRGIFRVVFKDADNIWKVKECTTAKEATEWVYTHSGSTMIRYAVHCDGTNIPFGTRESAEEYVEQEKRKGRSLSVTHRKPQANLPQEATALYYQN